MKVLLCFTLVAALCVYSQAELQESVEVEKKLCSSGNAMDNVICELNCRFNGNGSGKCEDGACKCQEAMSVSINTRACTNNACLSVCRSLGFRNGYCVSSTTCYCHN